MISLYTIENQTTGAIYFGQSNNFPRRKTGHLRDLKDGQHRNSYLQRSFNKHGENSFKIEELESHTTRELCNEAEKFYIGYLKFLGARVYNIRSGGGVGSTFPIETKIRWSQTRKGKKPSLEARLKHSLTLRNRPEEEKRRVAEAISNTLKGRVFTADHRAKLSAALKGRKPSEKCMDAARKAATGKPMPEQTRVALAIGRSKFKHTPEMLEKMSKAMKGRFAGDKHPLFGKHPSEETKSKMRAKAKVRRRAKDGTFISHEIIEIAPPEYHLDCIGSDKCRVNVTKCDLSFVQ